MAGSRGLRRASWLTGETAVYFGPHGSITAPGYARRVIRLALAIGLALALVASLAVGAPAKGRVEQDGVFAGLATWVDIYDGPVYSSPVQTANRIAARGVRTVFAETANYGAATDVVRPQPLGRFVDALQAQGVRVVAWYLPGFDKPARDLRRTRAMLSFRTPRGAAFDGVALDVEATVVKSVARRTARLRALARTLRAEAGSTPVAAIVLPPRMLERRADLWPGFPWAELAALSDAIVPMAYTSSFRGYEATYGYVARSLASLRAAVGQDAVIHAAGGVANRLSPDELQAFADAVADDGTVSGWSLYDYMTSNAGAWSSLAPLGGTR